MRQILLASATALALSASGAAANPMLLAAQATTACYAEVPNSNAFLLTIKKNKSGGVNLRYRKNRKNKVSNEVYEKAKADFSACMDEKMGSN